MVLYEQICLAYLCLVITRHFTLHPVYFVISCGRRYFSRFWEGGTEMCSGARAHSVLTVVMRVVSILEIASDLYREGSPA